MTTLLLRLIAFSGFLAVSLGAMGAHALKETLNSRQSLGTWQTAAHYHLIHTVACLALVAWASAQPARATRLRRIALLWLVGCLLFAGSLYGLAVGGPGLLGPITPLGGLAFITGWILLALEPSRLDPR